MGVTAPPDEALPLWPATALVAALRARTVSAADLLEVHLARARRLDPRLGALVARDEAGARASAHAADTEAARGAWRGPLHGLPMTVKDTWSVAGMPATSGLPHLRNHRPARDAPAVARLRAAGAIVWGKTNLPLASYDWQCRSGFLPRGTNPWSAAHTPGGSSGGAAAAVAAGLSPLELGSDVAGSIRVPAHCCGVVGLRPSEGLVSLEGHGVVPGAPHALRHLVAGGPLARTVGDVRLAMRVLVPEAGAWEPAPRRVADLRIAVTRRLGPYAPDADTGGALASAVAALDAAGAAVVEVPPPFDDEMLLRAWGAIQGFELRAAAPWLARALPGAGPGGRALARLVFGRSGFSAALGRGWTGSPCDYFRALDVRDAAIAAMDGFLAGWDAWLTPVGLTTALAHQRTGRPVPVDGRPVPYGEVFARWCCPTAVTAHPVLVVPAARTPSGLPVGLQLHGRRHHDAALLDVGEAVATCLPALGAPPLD